MTFIRASAAAGQRLLPVRRRLLRGSNTGRVSASLGTALTWAARSVLERRGPSRTTWAGGPGLCPDPSCVLEPTVHSPGAQVRATGDETFCELPPSSVSLLERRSCVLGLADCLGDCRSLQSPAAGEPWAWGTCQHSLAPPCPPPGSGRGGPAQGKAWSRRRSRSLTAHPQSQSEALLPFSLLKEGKTLPSASSMQRDTLCQSESLPSASGPLQHTLPWAPQSQNSHPGASGPEGRGAASSPARGQRGPGSVSQTQCHRGSVGSEPWGISLDIPLTLEIDDQPCQCGRQNQLLRKQRQGDSAPSWFRLFLFCPPRERL